MAIFNRRSEGGDARKIRELEAQVAALDRAQAVCEFSMDGQVLRANDNFLQMIGCSAGELTGRSYAALVGPQEAAGAEHRELWLKLNRGEFVAGKFRFRSKPGEDRCSGPPTPR